VTRRQQTLSVKDRFNRAADRVTSALGSIQAVVASVLVVVLWALCGPLFGFSDSWQLVINTATTVITFWMVFVIQNSQNRDARAIHIKLDEIIRTNDAARNELIVAEKEPEEKVAAVESELQAAAAADAAERSDRAPRQDDQGGEWGARFKTAETPYRASAVPMCCNSGHHPSTDACRQPSQEAHWDGRDQANGPRGRDRNEEAGARP